MGRSDEKGARAWISDVACPWWLLHSPWNFYWHREALLNWLTYKNKWEDQAETGGEKTATNQENSEISLEGKICIISQ